MAALVIASPHDDWALQKITLDYANRYVPDILIANANDMNGRGIDLWVTKNDSPFDLETAKVHLVWRHENGNQDLTEFYAIAAKSGHFKVYYPNAMMHAGMVLARIAIDINSGHWITGSRDFRIMVERNPIDEDEALADESLTAFQQAVIDLNNLEASVTAKESARVSAETSRAAAEEARAAFESERASAEITREANESERASAESSRAAAEEARVNNEENRKTNEAMRVDAEQKRVKEFAAIKDEAGVVEEERDRQLLSGVYEGQDLMAVLGTSDFADLCSKLHLLAEGKDAGGIRIGDYMDVTPTTTTVNKGAAMRYRVAGIGHNYQFGDLVACPWAFWMVPDAPVDMTDDSYAAPNSNYIYWNTTEGNNGNIYEKCPYIGSNLHNWELDNFLPALPTALQNVLVNHRILLETRYSPYGALDAATGCSWRYTGKVFSLSEMEVYGCCARGTSAYSVGADAQLPLFRDSRYRLLSNVSWWLRSVASGSSSRVCVVSELGSADSCSPTEGYVRPRSCFLVG